ncbi:MAG: glycosyltransferase [Acidimicrobiia bacterium]
MARILWLTGEYLLPADSGLYRYSLDMMNALSEMGHDIHAIGRNRTPEPLKSAPEEWTLLPHRQPPMWRKMLHHLPVKVVEVWDDDYGDAVRRAMSAFRPDIVLFDHLRAGGALQIIDGKLPSIYVSQNDETLVKAKMVPAARGVRKPALWIDMQKIRRFEDQLLTQCSGVSAISRADVATFEERGTKGPIVHTLPSYRGTRRSSRKIDESTPRRIAMISTLYWGAKIDNMVMALRGLKPAIDADVEVVVFTGGYQPPTEISAQYPTVRFEGFVEDFDAELADCRIGVVYEPVGGGFKMKTLDFIFHRVPLVTGDTSAASLPLTPGEDVEQAHDEAHLGRVVMSMIDDIDRLNRMQESAFATCRDLFTSESARPLSELVDQITSSGTPHR